MNLQEQSFVAANSCREKGDPEGTQSHTAGVIPHFSKHEPILNCSFLTSEPGSLSHSGCLSASPPPGPFVTQLSPPRCRRFPHGWNGLPCRGSRCPAWSMPAPSSSTLLNSASLPSL